jgi:hypothetical protein
VFEIVLPFEARSMFGRQLRVAHSAAGVSRGLEPDEYVVLRDPELGRRFLGRVVDLDFDLDDTYYSVQVEGMLAAAVADEYTRAGAVHTNDVAALLRELQTERVPV